MSDDTYEIVKVQDRLEEELGERPTRNQMHKAVSGGPRATNARVSVVSGLPAPVSRSSALTWRAEDIERWIAHHPRKLRAAAEEELLDGLKAGIAHGSEEQRSMITQARAAGLSWGSISEVCSKVGWTVSRQGLQARFG